jgi:hypothetical protein
MTTLPPAVIAVDTAVSMLIESPMDLRVSRFSNYATSVLLSSNPNPLSVQWS